MPENGLRGPFALTDDAIDAEIRERQPGAYALEDSADLIHFRVLYVGRSDIDVNNQLHVHVGTYKRFLYQPCSDPAAAFEKECALYHQFEPRDNPIHPQRPPGMDWKCPRCRLFG
jgi:hypothetical protein